MSSSDEYLGLPPMATRPLDEAMKKRVDDLDSIEWGTPAKGGSKKLYFNARMDSEEHIKARIDMMNELSSYANKGGL